MEQGPPVTSSERPDATPDAPVSQEPFWVPEHTTYHQRFGDHEVLITDKRRVNLAEVTTNSESLLEPKQPEGPRVQHISIGEQDVLVTDKRGLRPQEVDSTFDGSTLENGYGEKNEVSEPTAAPTEEKAAPAETTPTPEAPVEEDSPAPKRVPTPADVHHGSRTQPSKRVQPEAEAGTPEGSAEKPTDYEALIDSDASLGLLKSVATHYGVAKALKERGFQDTDVENFEQVYNERANQRKLAGVDEDLLKYVEDHYVNNPSEKDIDDRIKELEGKKSQPKPTEKADEAPVEAPKTPDEAPVEGELIDDEPAPSEPIEGEEAKPQQTEAEKAAEVKAASEKVGEKIKRAGRRFADKFRELFDLSKKGEQYGDPRSAIREFDVDPNASPEEQKKQLEVNATKLDMGRGARHISDFRRWLNGTAEGAGIRNGAKISKLRARFGFGPKIPENLSKEEVETRAKAAYELYKTQNANQDEAIEPWDRLPNYKQDEYRDLVQGIKRR